MRLKGRHVILSLVCIVLGFMISFSYQFTKKETPDGRLTDRQWSKENEIRTLLIEQKERNRELQEELSSQQEIVREIEEELAMKEKEQIYFNLVEDVEKYRMFIGEIKVKGPGVSVTLEDASYVPSGEDVNNYLVHESHLFKVINELFISGAQAVSVNGKRLTHNSYLYCNGPVVTVDGNQYPAPFIISAIGNPDVLIPALNINGGVNEQLVQDNIVVTIEKAEITMDPLLQTSND
ncbi:DUF881 domain-containing protein [Litchfieldia salsa]|uniref:Uncharacterized conserved protein YlxW, UPF0749 family n=1 Tax=Litchfieldia salsa TaxID=930152 RepID=A0A1H0RDY0_9BACI|nr:DUF881 domain-containing protein [Litchfieldia salsa]SDP27747.1 Uncharacterized conserved protein YlxW, UPF0749 family [Litchfieldia salsa]